MIVHPDILIFIATLVVMFSFSSALGSWANRQWPVASLISLVIGVGLFAFVHVQSADGLSFWDIPNAFINVAAMVLR